MALGSPPLFARSAGSVVELVVAAVVMWGKAAFRQCTVC